MQWIIERFKGDGGIYAICPVCNFMHCVSRPDENLVPRIVKNYVFCPFCGEYLYIENPEDVSIIKYQRDISVYHNHEININAVQTAINKVFDEKQK